MVDVVGKNPAVKKRITCRRCSSILEYVPSEVLESSGTDISGSGYTQGLISCPSCGHVIVVWER